MTTKPPSDKQRAANRLTDLLGLGRVDIDGKQEGTVPAHVFRAAAKRAGVPYQSRAQATEAVILHAGHVWQPHYDSRKTRSLGGGNITVAGLEALVEALAAIEDGAYQSGRGAAGSAQDRMLDPERRKKVEDAAQDWLMEHYRQQGYEVTDTRFGNPYDAVADVGNGYFLYLEAKGTTSAGEKVIVTRNEVAWAREHLGQCVMGIWSGIEFNENGDVDPTRGYKQVVYWDPGDNELAPIAYDWQVPNEKQLWPDVNYD